MKYDPLVMRITDPDEFAQFIENIKDSDPHLVPQAKRREVELRAEKAGAQTDMERDALEAVYAYQVVLAQRQGKKTAYASRTWPMFDRHGIKGAVERAVNRKADTPGYKALMGMGLQDKSFESVVLKYRDQFTPKVVKRCEERLAQYKAEADQSE